LQTSVLSVLCMKPGVELLYIMSRKLPDPVILQITSSTICHFPLQHDSFDFYIFLVGTNYLLGYNTILAGAPNLEEVSSHFFMIPCEY